MSSEELGLDTFIKKEGQDHFVTILEDVTGDETMIHLEQQPMMMNRAIVSQGTAC